jgi:hypothetical protein
MVKDHSIKGYGRAEAELHSFLTSALDGGDCQLHALIALSPVAFDRRLGGFQAGLEKNV